MRLDKYLASCLQGVGQKAAQALIADGRVTVNGLVVCTPSWQCLPQVEPVEVDGHGRLKEPWDMLLMINKPPNCVCTRERGSEGWRRARGQTVDTEAPEEGDRAPVVDQPRAQQKSIYDCLPEEFSHPKLGVFGRLDIDTTGVLLLGTDGGLQSLLTHPSSKVMKSYIATLDANCKDEFSSTAVQQFAEGVRLADGSTCQPAELEILDFAPRGPAVSVGGAASADSPSQGDVGAASSALHREAAGAAGSTVAVTPVSVRVRVHEGRYHQVKRMLGAVGGCVVSLHRESLGGLTVDGLEPGEVRHVTRDELFSLLPLLPADRSVDERRGSQKRAL